ncbi:MAG: Trm112 family protein [Terriglobales bacterium]
MSADLVIPICPACGSDRTSDASHGEIYCVDCNRIYPVVESDTGPAHARLAPETGRKAA